MAVSITGSICTCGFVKTQSNPHTGCQQQEPSPVTQRILDVRVNGRQGEYLDATRRAGGSVTLRHFVPGKRPADTVLLDPDQAAQLAAFLLRTLRSRDGNRFEITEAGRMALAEPTERHEIAERGADRLSLVDLLRLHAPRIA